MADDSQEISIFEIADWLWSFRSLMLACATIGVVWAGLGWLNAKPDAPSYDISLQVFSGGTPVRGPAEIADILVAGLNDASLKLVSAPSANPVIFKTSDGQLAGRIEASVAALSDALLAEVSAQKTELERLLPINENALPQYLSAKSFIEGVNSGLVPLVETSVVPKADSSRSLLQTVILPFVASGFLFFVIAGAISFARGWKNRHDADVSIRP